LHLKGRDLLHRSLLERWKQLEQLATGFCRSGAFESGFRVSLANFTATVKKVGLEGIVAKHSNSIYIPGKDRMLA